MTAWDGGGMDGDLALARSTAVPHDSGGTCPYPGLASFTTPQAGQFHGRDRLTAALVTRLDDCLVRGGPVMVLGASGAGKSSLLRAGLLPKLAAGGLTSAGSPHWPLIVFTPGAHPMRAAAAALLAALPAESLFRLPPRSAPADLDGLLSAAMAAAGPGARVVLVVDQLEELFRLCEDEVERAEFISWLWQVADGGPPTGPDVLAVCAVRADFYRDCLRYPQLAQALQDHQVVVDAMSRAELTEAITGPAEAAGLDLEPGLTDLLLTDLLADDGAGRLPLLAHALRVTWQQRHGRTLTVDGYRSSGGIESAIAQSAEQSFAQLSAAAREKARSLFLRLVAIGPTSGEDVCRPVPRVSLTGPSTGEVIDAYAGAGLLTDSGDTVQIAHEALLRAWPRLNEWLNDDRVGQLTRQRTENDAAGWHDTGQEPSLLYRGARLETAAAWAQEHSRELTDTARQFIAESSQVARRTRLTQRAGIIALAALLLIATVTAAVAIIQRSSAISQSNRAQAAASTAASAVATAQSQALAAEAVSQLSANAGLGMLLALQSYERAPTAQAASALIQAAQQPLNEMLTDGGTPVGGVAFSPNGRTLAVGDNNGVALWNAATGKQTATLDKGSTVESLAFSSDGRTLAVGGDNGDVTLWDTATGQKTATLDTLAPGQQPVPLADGGNPIDSVTFGPGNQTLATAGPVGDAVDLWNAATGRRTAILFQGSPVSSVAFNPNGFTLAAGGSSGHVALWDIRTGARTATLAEGSAVNSVAFSPGGQTLAVGDESGNVGLWVWAVTTAHRTTTLAEGNPVETVAFSPTGGTLAAGDIGGRIGLWDLATGQQSLTLNQGSQVDSVAFSPDGRTLAAGDSSGGIGLWNAASSSQSAVLAAGSPIASEAFSPSGTQLAVADSGNAVGLWDVATGQSTATLAEGSPAESVMFSPNGLLLAVGDYTGHVGLWNVSTDRRTTTLNIGGTVVSMAFSPSGRTLAVAVGNATGRVALYDVATGHLTAQFSEGFTISSLAFSPDGTTLAVGDDSGHIGLWNVSTARKTATLNEGNAVDTVAFSPNSRTLAAGDTAGAIDLWNVATALQTATLADGTTINSTAFSPSGSLLVTGDNAGNVDFWNTATAKLAATLPEADGGVTEAAFAPSGQALAIGAKNGTVTLMRQNLTTLTLPFFTHLVCGKIQENLTQAQWAQFAPGQPYQQACP